MLRAGAWTDLTRAATIFVLAALALVVQSEGMNTLHRVGRTALPYVLMFSVLMAFAVDAVARVSRRTFARVACAAAVGLLAFAVTLNLIERTTVWSFDASSEQAMAEIESSRASARRRQDHGSSSPRPRCTRR